MQIAFPLVMRFNLQEKSCLKESSLKNKNKTKNPTRYLKALKEQMYSLRFIKLKVTKLGCLDLFFHCKDTKSQRSFMLPFVSKEM